MLTYFNNSNSRRKAISKEPQMTTRREIWRTEQLDALCRAILTLETVDEVALFLRDLRTRTEIDGLSSRWSVTN